MYKINDLYDLTHSQAKDYLSKYEYPWQALKGIKDFIIELGETLGDEYQEVNEHVWIHKDAKVFDSAYIGSPCIIGAGTCTLSKIITFFNSTELPITQFSPTNVLPLIKAQCLTSVPAHKPI